mmetsp:Transcript_26239/g.55683  ORF Transcript_26239/g.55683 Transcript_26239/m.55683 type:complete len:200 (-) Transcript_26239:1710-2309(-)
MVAGRCPCGVAARSSLGAPMMPVLMRLMGPGSDRKAASLRGAKWGSSTLLFSFVPGSSLPLSVICAIMLSSSSPIRLDSACWVKSPWMPPRPNKRGASSNGTAGLQAEGSSTVCEARFSWMPGSAKPLPLRVVALLQASFKAAPWMVTSSLRQAREFSKACTRSPKAAFASWFPSSVRTRTSSFELFDSLAIDCKRCST